MKKLSIKQLTKICCFNSGFVSGGSDYWVMYQYSENSEILIVNSSGSNFGWEYEHWEYIDKPTAKSLDQFLDPKVPDIEKCKLILTFDRKSVYSINLSKPEDL